MLLDWFESWLKIWQSAEPALPRTAQSIIALARERHAYSEAHKVNAAPIRVNKTEYIALLEANVVDFIYERGHVPRPTLWGIYLDVRP